MNTPIISYLPGMSGDFLAWQIHKDSKFFPIDHIDITTTNRFIFPNMLEVLGGDAKMHPTEKMWPVKPENIEILRNSYNNKNICFPTHWHNKLDYCLTPEFLTMGIRLYCQSRSILKLCYFMWWIKSHVDANDPWDNRILEIEKMIRSGGSNSVEANKLPNSFHNWKFLALKNNLLRNGELCFTTYVKDYFEKVYSRYNTKSVYSGYTNFAVDNVIYTGTELQSLADHVNVEINKDSVAEYAERNLNLIESELGLRFDSADYNNDEVFFDKLTFYLKDKIHERPIYDYNYRKRGYKSIRNPQ